jgi:hypothetical protein
MINTEELIKLISTLIIVIIGWIIVHYFTSIRDAKNKRREISINHLISSYEILTNEISQRPQNKERNQKIEKMISQIQLCGTSEQIKLVIELVSEIKSGNGNLDPLINNLKNNLRAELGLTPINRNVEWIRYKDDQV